jgi:peptidoglycan LD-endopeptidase LytH
LPVRSRQVSFYSNMSAALTEILRRQPAFAPVIATTLPYVRLDFSSKNKDLLEHDLSETAVFSNYVFTEMLQNGSYAGIGGYGEDRVIYQQKKHFSEIETEPRSIHLGTDIWIKAGEPIFAPLNAEVHSFAFNNHYGDYGPTIILKHELEGTTFFTLYGHLSLPSLNGLATGQKIEKGQQFATVGPYPENGDWPPHLHFQVIGDIGDYSGDFPGVSSVRDREHYLSICPDANLILRILENECA